MPGNRHIEDVLDERDQRPGETAVGSTRRGEQASRPEGAARAFDEGASSGDISRVRKEGPARANDTTPEDDAP